MDKDFYIILVGRVSQILFSLVSARVLTTLLSKSEVGNVYLIGSISSFFVLGLISPVSLYLWRKFHGWQKDKSLLKKLRFFKYYLVVLSLVGAILVVFLNKILGIGAGIELASLVLVVSLTVFAQNWNTTVTNSFNMMNMRFKYVALTTVTTFLGVAGSVLFTWIGSASAVNWLGGQLVAQIAISWIAYAMLKSQVVEDDTKIHKVEFNIVRTVSKFVVPLIPTMIFMWLQFQGYRIVVEKMMGLEFLGMMGVGFAIASNISNAFESVIHQTYLPKFYDGINSDCLTERTAAWNKIANITIPIYIVLATFVSCLSPFIVSILVDKKFHDAYLFLIFGAWIEFFRMTTGIVSTVAHSEMRTHALVRPYAIGGLCAVIGILCLGGASNRIYLIPMLLVFCGGVTIVSMYRDMSKLMPCKIELSVILKSFSYSVPFAVVYLLFRQFNGLVASIVITGLCGIYMLAVSQKLAFHRHQLTFSSLP